MIDWPFRITTPTAFAADIAAFCQSYGYGGFPLLAARAPLETADFVHTEFNGDLRFDFDVHDLRILLDPLLGTTLDRGWHVNVRAGIVPGREASGVAGLALLDTRLRGFFLGLPATANVAPAPLTGGQLWHGTGNTTLIDPPPAAAKRAWLGAS